VLMSCEVARPLCGRFVQARLQQADFGNHCSLRGWLLWCFE